MKRKKILVEMSEVDIKTLCHCLHLEYRMLEFRRGLGKPGANEKFLVKLWKRLSDIRNDFVNVKK